MHPIEFSASQFLTESLQVYKDLVRAETPKDPPLLLQLYKVLLSAIKTRLQTWLEAVLGHDLVSVMLDMLRAP